MLKTDQQHNLRDGRRDQYLAGPRRRIAGDPRNGFFAKIVSSSSVGTNQWRYTIAEVLKSTAAYGTWTTDSEGYSGYAYNISELNGTGTSATANNAIVWAWTTRYAGDVEVWFYEVVPGIAQNYGKVVTPGVASPSEGWNSVTLDPCSRAGVDNGDSNVTAYALSGANVMPDLTTDEVVGYVSDGTDNIINICKFNWYYGDDS